MSFYLVAVLFTAFNLLDNEYFGLWDVTRTLFSVYSSLSRMDLQFRGGLHVYSERLVLANTLLYPYAWQDRLTPQQFQYRSEMSLLAFESGTTILKTKGLFRYLVNDIKYKKENLGKAIVDYMSNPLISNLPTQLLQKILKARLEIDNFEPGTVKKIGTVDLANPTFVSTFKVLLEQFQENLELMEPFLRDQAPPYDKIPEEILSENFSIPSNLRFDKLKNAWSGSLDFHNSTLLTIKDLVINSEPAETKKMVAILQGVFSFLFLCFVAASIYLANAVSWWMFDLLTQYKNLRKEEQDIHRVIFSHRLWYFQRYKLDEPMLVGNYMKSTYSTLGQDMIAMIESAKDPAAKQNSTHSRRVNKVRFNLRFKSILTIWILTAASFFFVIFFIVIQTLDSQYFQKAHSKMVFYTNTYEYITEAYHFYLCHSLLVMFGNYVRIRDELPNVIIAQKQVNLPMLTTIQYLSKERNNLKTFFGGQRGETIDTLLFGNACEVIPSDRLAYETEMNVCRSNQFAMKGFIAFLYNQRESLAETREIVTADQDFLARSETDWLIMPFMDYLYTIPNMSFRIASKFLYEVTYDLILTFGEAAIDEELENLRSLILSLNRIVPNVLVFSFCSLFLWLILHTLHQDIKLTSESLFNMMPEIIIQNKVVNKKFNETYSMKY